MSKIHRKGGGSLSRSKNILVVVIAICVVLTAGIVHIVVILNGIGEAPAEWKDFFVLDGTRYYNSYSIIDSSYAERVVGRISSNIPHDADDSSNAALEGQAVYLRTGTLIYSIKGFEETKYVAAYDNGEYCLYCTEDCTPGEVIKQCGVKTLRKDLDFKCFFIDTVCAEKSGYGVRLSAVLNKTELDRYLSRYANDFKLSDNNYTYKNLFENRSYDDYFFKDKWLIAVRLPEDDGKYVYELDRIISDEATTTIQLTENCLPENVVYDKCTVRHMFIEIDKQDYSDQALSFQVERKYHRLPDETEFPETDDPEGSVPEYMFSLIKNRTQALGTVFEALVLKEYDKCFFDTNDLLILRCLDEKNEYDYSINECTFDNKYLYVSITRRIALDPFDNRQEYYVLTVPSNSLDDKLILPLTIDSDQEETPECPAVNIELRDTLIIDSILSFETIAEKYGINPELYNELFFKNYVLLFAGYLTCSPDESIKYASVQQNDGVIELSVFESLPKTAVFSTAFKYVAIPYLRSDYNGEELIVITTFSDDREFKRPDLFS